MQMKVHPSGELEVVSTPKIEEILNKKQSNQRFVYPIAKSNAAGGIAALDDNCDVISLESSEYDDIGDFSLFPQLVTHGSNLNHRSSHVINTSLITKRLLTESMSGSHQGKPMIAHSPPANQSIPKPHAALTSTPSRTTSSSQALQKIKSSTIKLPTALVSSSKSKVSVGSIPMNPLTMTPSSSSSSRKKPLEPTSASSQENGLAPQVLVLPGSQYSASKESIAMTTVNTPQSHHHSQPQSQCSSVQSIPTGKSTRPPEFTYEELAMFSSLSGFGNDDIVSSVTSQLVEHLDQDVSLFSAPSIVQPPSSQSTTSSSSSLLPPSEFMRSLTPSHIVLESNIVSRLSIDVTDSYPDVAVNDLVTPSNNNTIGATNRELISIAMNQSLTKEETPVDLNGGSVPLLVNAISSSNRMNGCSTPMSCESASSQVPVNLNLHSNGRSLSFAHSSVSPSPTSELGFDAILSHVATDIHSDQQGHLEELPATSATQSVNFHGLIPSPSMVTGIAMDEEHDSNHSAENTTGETMMDHMELIADSPVTEEKFEEKHAEEVPTDSLSPAIVKPAVISLKELLSSQLEDYNYFSMDMDTEVAASSAQCSESKDVDSNEDKVISQKTQQENATVVEENKSSDNDSLQHAVDPSVTHATGNAEESTETVNDGADGDDDDQGIRPPLHPQSKKRKRRSHDVEATSAPASRAASTSITAPSSSRSTRHSLPATEQPSRRSRQATTSSYVNKRDAFLGSWPSRKQSAASGHWRI
jgi:hypothetical protein